MLFQFKYNMFRNNIHLPLKTTISRASLKICDNILKIFENFDCLRYFCTAAANFPAVALRCVRIFPGVNSRAELVTLAPGLRPLARGLKKISHLRLCHYKLIFTWPLSTSVNNYVSPCLRRLVVKLKTF